MMAGEEANYFREVIDILRNSGAKYLADYLEGKSETMAHDGFGSDKHYILTGRQMALVRVAVLDRIEMRRREGKSDRDEEGNALFEIFRMEKEERGRQ